MTSSIPPQHVSGLTIDLSPVKLTTHKLKWRPAVYALILNQNGEILLQENTLNGRKDLAGGGVDIWESLETALLREVWEETGLKIRIIELLHVGEHFFQAPNQEAWHALHFFYHAEILSGELRSTILPKEPTVNPHWVNPRHLHESDLTLGWEALQKLLAKETLK